MSPRSARVAGRGGIRCHEQLAGEGGRGGALPRAAWTHQQIGVHGRAHRSREPRDRFWLTHDRRPRICVLHGGRRIIGALIMLRSHSSQGSQTLRH